MAEKYSFFNSVRSQNGVGDRTYKATDISDYFGTFIENGVHMNIGSSLQVIADTSNMSVKVKSGIAYINGYMYQNTSDLILTHDGADGVLNRIDRIVVQLNYTQRLMRTIIKKGTFASTPVAPSLQRDADIYELALADVSIGKGTIAITQSIVTDQRLNAAVCGIASSFIKPDPTAIFNQFQDWFNSTKTNSTQDVTTFLNEFQTWINGQKTVFSNDFNTWFNSIKGLLSGDVATNLANKITQLEQNTAAQLADIAINVKDFGAKGDGVTDDTNAFKAAALTGKPLLIPYTSSHYKLTSVIDISNSIKFDGLVKMYCSTGNREQAVIRVNNYRKDSTLFIINPLIDGGWNSVTPQSEHSHGILIAGSKNVVVSGGVLSNFAGDGVCVEYNYGMPITYPYSENILIKDTVINNPYRCLVAVVSASNITIDGIKGVKNNTFVGAIDIETDDDSSQFIKNLTIKNSEITCDNDNCINFYNVFPVENVLIDNCKINSANSYGIRSAGNLGNLKGITIRNTVFDVKSKDAIHLPGGTGGDVLIENCKILNQKKEAGYARAVYITAGNNSVTINNLSLFSEQLSNSGAVAIYAKKVEINDSYISGYCYDGGYSGVLNIYSENIKLKNNVFKNYRYGIFISSTSTCDIIIEGNVFDREPTYADTRHFIFDFNTNPNILSCYNNVYSSCFMRFYSRSSYPIKVNSDISTSNTYYASSQPASGSYNKSDRVYNSNATVGQPKSWVCTVAGTPGTWVSEGNL